jgi:hypothetical protein
LIRESDLAAFVKGNDKTARELALRTLGLHPVKVRGTLLSGWRTFDVAEFEQRLELLIQQVPFLEEELPVRSADLGLKESAISILTAPGAGVLFESGLGWIRRARRDRDVAYLFLLRCGEPQNVDAIAERTACNARALAEKMRRDGIFCQIQPEGSWALSDWPLPEASQTKRGATEVLIEVLRQSGPMTLKVLISEAHKRYPVSPWRYSQTVRDSRIGLTVEGLYDLVERGAVPQVEREPRQPQSMKASDNGRVVAARLTVTGEMLRGSGIAVNRWLPWKIGLSSVPNSRRFALEKFDGEVTVRLTTSTASISSLRAYVLEMGLVKGCDVAVIFNTETESSSLVHSCVPGRCPAAPLHPDRDK